MPLSPGIGLGVCARHDIIGGGGGYVAKAVHFDGTASLAINSISCPDSSLCSTSFWFRHATNQSKGIWQANATGIYEPEAYVSVGGRYVTSFADIDNTNNYQMESLGVLVVDLWHHLLTSVSLNFPAGNKIGVIYLDGVASKMFVTDNNAAINPILFNGGPFSLGNDGLGFGPSEVMDIADFWFAPGQSLLTGSDIAPETIALFRNQTTGKPVSLGANGTSPTGTSPSMFFSGDHTGFAVNQGTGGTFALTGSLTNASTSPSD